MVTILNEKRRGCGYRKQGGLYLIAGGPEAPCGKLPLPLEVCPTCSQGIKPARGWTWVDPHPLFAEKFCNLWEQETHCVNCILDKALLPDRMGLLWVGEQFYPTPADFLREGSAEGICRRLHAIPKDFELGTTWVLLAHRKAIQGPDLHKEPTIGNIDWLPGIFSCFLPRQIQYVVRPEDSEEKLADMTKRGITPVKLVWDQDSNGNHLFEEQNRPVDEDDE